MDAVGPGTLLAGRYHVQQRVHQGTWSSVWQAVDETLERPVSLRVVDVGHPRGSDVVDAARRAAGVEDPRLQRVLDVGVEDGLTYVVSEWIGADSLTDLLRSGVPPADEVRRLVGEAATALEAARHRGLHHLMLTPDSLLQGPRRPGHGHRAGRGRGSGRHRHRRRCRGQPARRPRAGRPHLRRADRALAAGPDARTRAAAAGRLRPARTLRARLRSARRPGRTVPPGACPDSGTTVRPTPGRSPPPWLPGRPDQVVGPRRTSGAFPISLVTDHGPATAVIPAVNPSSVQSAVNAPRPAVPPAPPVRPPTTHVPPQLPEPESERGRSHRWPSRAGQAPSRPHHRW